MIDINLAAQLDVLTASTRVALADYPQLVKQIQGGLVLAVCGLVSEYLGSYVVLSSSSPIKKWRQVSLSGTPGRWSCGCIPASKGPIVEFLGGWGHICKHICAVALAMNLQQPVSPVTTVWDMVERLCSIPPDVLFGDTTEIHLPRNKMRLLRDKGAYVLAYSHYHSKPVAQLSGSEMFLLLGAYNNYNNLLIEAGIKQPVQQKELI